MIRKLLGVVVVGLVLAGCGIPLDEFVEEASSSSGTPCMDDSDCVPYNCCGDSSTVRHYADPPSCAGVQCGANLPTLLNGCGIPICRNDACAVARDPYCG